MKLYSILCFICIFFINNSMTLAQTSNHSTPQLTQALPILSSVPNAKDIKYPGVMEISVDATNLEQRIFYVEQVIPVEEKIKENGGDLTLLYSKWLPGKHAPRGNIEKLSGLMIHGNDKDKIIPWKRDPVEVFAFHISVPKGTKKLYIRFEFLAAIMKDQGRVTMTDSMMNIQWEQMSLYPAGFYTRGIKVKSDVKFPKEWTAASGLPSKKKKSTYHYEETDYETLVDSPIFAGAYSKVFALSPKVNLNVFADDPKFLESKDEHILAHKKLVEQARKLFGTEHFDKYEFLLALSSELGGIGLEHHRSSENGVGTNYFTEWDKGPGSRGLLPHEMVHSWNGKFRRPERMWVPDYSVPMVNDLLWVYEGQTQFWGHILSARSGLFTKQQALDLLASWAAAYDATVGRKWRHLEDTTNDPIITPRAPKPWRNQQRSEDYYVEGAFIWLEIDGILRENTKGEKCMDDFAKAFFGKTDGDWGILTYNFKEVVDTLNAIYKYDWASFLQTRLSENAKGAPLNGLTKGGYKLVYTDTPNETDKKAGEAKSLNLLYSLGIKIKGNEINAVLWDTLAFKKKLRMGNEILAVNGLKYNHERMKNAIIANKNGKSPIKLLIKSGEKFDEIKFKYKDGLKYPRLVKINDKIESGLDKLLSPQ